MFDAYLAGANYFCGGQIRLLDNPHYLSRSVRSTYPRLGRLINEAS